MKFSVVVQPIAQSQIDHQVHFIAVEKSEPQSAEIWLAKVGKAISSLEFMPTRCPLAPEDQFVSELIRMMPVESHLILFSIDEDEAVVNIVGFRAGRELPKPPANEQG